MEAKIITHEHLIKTRLNLNLGLILQLNNGHNN